ncbi:hypothetical protein BDZ89DRAFT_1173246 [Hymenopellis radicata]|nr:hypothetical protein BDZ89DRAFT_1173246 [Hymenopellis radicata]
MVNPDFMDYKRCREGATSPIAACPLLTSAEPTITAAATEPTTTTTERPLLQRHPRRPRRKRQRRSLTFRASCCHCSRRQHPKRRTRKVEDAPPTLPEPVTEDTPAAAAEPAPEPQTAPAVAEPAMETVEEKKLHDDKNTPTTTTPR